MDIQSLTKVLGKELANSQAECLHLLLVVMILSKDMGQEKLVEGVQESCCHYCQWKIVERLSVKQDEHQQMVLQKQQTGFAQYY